MLDYIHCQNFRKHADLRVQFTAGINAIRAVNEAGKSTLLEAIAYADFGAAGLKESIDDVVTYGVPTSKLRVEKGFTHAGVSYRVVRSPKGAELFANGNDTPLVTGQKEVTKFMENLFGTSQAMAAKLMLAKQKDMGGALAGGPTEAGRMIENLANLDLIDELIGLVTENLPAGDTSAAKASIETWRNMGDAGELPDLAPLEVVATTARAASEEATGAYQAQQQQLELMRPAAAAARQTLQRGETLTSALAARGRQIETLEGTLAGELPSVPAETEITTLREKVAAQAQVADAEKLHAALKQAKIEPLQWDEPLDTLRAEITKTEAKALELQGARDNVKTSITTVEKAAAAEASAYSVTKVQIEGKLIKESICPFCDKDLRDIPEVSLVNRPLYQELARLKTEHEAQQAQATAQLQGLREKLPQIEADLRNAEVYFGQLRAVLQEHDRAELLYARAGTHIVLDRSGVPAAWKWVGPTADDTTDYAGQLRAMEKQRDEATRAAARRDEQQAQLQDLQRQQDADSAARQALATAEATETLKAEEALSTKVQELLGATRAAEQAFAGAQQALELARQRRQQMETQAEKAKAGLQAAEAQLAEIEANNVLVKKLRSARPVITDKLWSLVLAAVSVHLGKVRGEQSIITRADGKFKVNGRPASGLSGSAEDSMGLGIRIALTRTFLPNIDFLMLDEPAAACNDERETAMLGLLATCGFEQVILVTHSPLADSFAQNVITI